MKRGIAWAVALGLGILTQHSAGAARIEESCLAAAEASARRHAVPAELLRAVALVESGTRRAGRLMPWPWTLNVAGAGHWFGSREEALDHARKSIAAGQHSVDLGCFQINYRWHGGAFPSLESMLDPRAGADYAARFLRQLFDETGDWLAAVGFYHSRTPELAQGYRNRVAHALTHGSGDEARNLAAMTAPMPTVPALADRFGIDDRSGALAWLLQTGRATAIIALGERRPRATSASTDALSRSASLFSGGAGMRPAAGGLLRPAARPLLQPATNGGA